VNDLRYGRDDDEEEEADHHGHDGGMLRDE
jgi:hypothetical protein